MTFWGEKKAKVKGKKRERLLLGSFPLSRPFCQIKSLIVLTVKFKGWVDDGILFERIELNFHRIKVNSWEIDIYIRER